MAAAPLIAVLDANVLFPFTLRDTLLRAAAAGFYRVRWSSQILDEALSNLVSRSIMPADKASRLRSVMARAFPEAEVTGYEPLIPKMRNDKKDRHVAAAAVKAGAQVIVTANTKDFASLPDGLTAQSPDTFLCAFFELDPDAFVKLIRTQASDLVHPPMTVDNVLQRLAKVVPGFVAAVRAHL